MSRICQYCQKGQSKELYRVCTWKAADGSKVLAHPRCWHSNNAPAPVIIK